MANIIDPTVKYDIEKEQLYIEEKGQDDESGMPYIKRRYLTIHEMAGMSWVKMI